MCNRKHQTQQRHRLEKKGSEVVRETLHVCRPKQVAISFSGIFEVSDTAAIPGDSYVVLLWEPERNYIGVSR